MDYFDLAYTTPDTLEKIKAAELCEDFNSHLDPITSEGSLPVDENFPYMPGLCRRFSYWLERTFFLNFFTTSLNRKIFHTKVDGRKNLRGIKGAVYVCNHINKYDALAVNYALGVARPLKIMVADFNNRPGFLGAMMRADGILPFGSSLTVIRKFSAAVDWYLHHKTGVLFFPEGSEWWCYKKPRPMMDGAFHFAAAANVPVVPVFITFKDSGRTSKTGVSLPYFTVHILPPIYPDSAKNKSENTKLLKEAAYKSWCRQYEKSYGEKID